jgi:hypothetical protein
VAPQSRSATTIVLLTSVSQARVAAR